MGANRPGFVIQVENRRDRNYVHIGFVVCLEGSHVTPVKRFFFVFVHEVEGIHTVVIHHFGQNIFAKIVAGMLVLRVFQQNGDQHIGIEEIDAHRCGNRFRIQWRAQLSDRRFFLKAGNAIVRVNRHNAESISFAGIDLNGGQGHVGGQVNMLPEHEVIIHFVDVIAGEDQHVARLLRTDGINILINRVCGALVPLLADALHGRQHFDELSQFAGDDVPAFTNVAVEGEGLVLGENINPAQVGVNTI